MTPLLIPLPPTARGLITVSGPDAFSFLQNIVSNDLRRLEAEPEIHACLLSPQGKYLHDFRIAKNGEDTYLLNCEAGERKDDLLKRLSLYKLRANVSLSAQDLAPPDSADFEEWDKARIKRGLPDGFRDAEINNSTLSELNLDDYAVSYTKGCYVGQELVARMHNRNLGKKHLVPVEFKDTPPPFGTEIEPFGFMRSSCGSLGLILMPREIEDRLRQGHITDAPFHLLGL